MLTWKQSRHEFNGKGSQGKNPYRVLTPTLPEAITKFHRFMEQKQVWDYQILTAHLVQKDILV